MKILCGIYPCGDYSGDIYFSESELKARNIRDTEEKRHFNYSSRTYSRKEYVCIGEYFFWVTK